MFHMSNPFKQKTRALLKVYSMYLNILDSIRNCNPSVLLQFEKSISSLVTKGTGDVPLRSQRTAWEGNSCDFILSRRLANYKPTIWHDDYIQSLKSEYEVNFIISALFYIFGLNCFCIIII